MEEEKQEINFAEIEEKWQKRWEQGRVFEVLEDSKKPKFYVLEMFPYPSGSGLHMGHAWNYTIGDILARFKIMNGFNVLHPMGYDALGLPAENAAIEAGEHPIDYTNDSTKHFMEQQKKLGLTYDWTRMVNTADPSYYKWDQWIFLKMLEGGLAYQKESAVNFCPKCDTVLANEQVVDGKCWRHDKIKVEMRKLRQWFFKITDYADELYEGIKDLSGWPDRTKIMQKNWIGKSHGVNFKLKVKDTDIEFEVYDSIPQTFIAQTFTVIAPEHPMVKELVKGTEYEKRVMEFVEMVKKKKAQGRFDIEKDMEGIFTGRYVEDPFGKGDFPIWIASYVLADYGTGVVNCSAHDERDFAFAKKYDIPLRTAMLPLDKKESKKVKDFEYSYYKAKDGIVQEPIEFKGMTWEESREPIINYIEKMKFGRRAINFKLRDWGISRQRYWGTPIPIIHCEKCGVVPVPEKDLPVELPREVKFGEGNPLTTNEKWVQVKCPKCGEMARRETDTMDTFVNSSWYFLRYCDPKNDKQIFDKSKVKYWCPVDQYIGGAEHACMHLIYSRFYTKFLRDIGMLEFDEPAVNLFHQGMLWAEGGIKMSKSKPETCVLPEDVSKKYGMDTARFFLASLASPDKDINWSESGILGSLRFINKIFLTFDKIKFGKTPEELDRKLNLTIKNITSYLGNFEYRKATIELRELFDMITEENQIVKESLGDVLKLLNPFCPHITEELWERIGMNKSGKDFISIAEWPKYDEKKIKSQKKEVDLNEKIISQIKDILEKLVSKNVNPEKVYLYVVPFEVEKIDSEKISSEIGKKVKIYSVSEEQKYDPENKSKKARPGMPGVYLE